MKINTHILNSLIIKHRVLIISIQDKQISILKITLEDSERNLEII